MRYDQQRQAGLEHSKNQGRCEKVQGQGICVLPQLGFPFWLLLLREVSLAQAGPDFLIPSSTSHVLELQVDSTVPSLAFPVFHDSQFSIPPSMLFFSKSLFCSFR